MAETPEESSRPLAEISHGPSAFEAFLDRNQKGMIALAILLIAGAAAFIVIRGIKESTEQTAGEMLSKAEAVPELEALVKEYPDTAAAGSARVLMSEMQWANGDQDASIETLRAFIAADSAHPAVPSARASLATRLMQQGKNDEAATMFRELVGTPEARFIAPYALISLGDIAKADGRLEDAEKAYKDAQENYGTNPFSSLAAQHLKLLKFTAPAEIEAPPTPEPAKDGGLDIDLESGELMPSAPNDNPLLNTLGGENEAEPAEPATEPAPPEAPAESAEDSSPVEPELPAEGESN